MLAVCIHLAKLLRRMFIGLRIVIRTTGRRRVTIEGCLGFRHAATVDFHFAKLFEAALGNVHRYELVANGAGQWAEAITAIIDRDAFRKIDDSGYDAGSFNSSL